MLEFVINNTFVWCQIFEQSVGFPDGRNHAPLLTDLFCIHMRRDSFNNLFMKWQKYLAEAFISTFLYINALSTCSTRKYPHMSIGYISKSWESTTPQNAPHHLCM
jgi:hypothetical protein